MDKFSSKAQFFELFAGRKVNLATPGVSHLLKSLTNENLNFIELAAVLEQFPSVAVRIIALANSAWSTPIEPITTIEAACSRLGINIVKSVSIALAVSAPFNTTRCASFRADYFWSRTMLVAEAVGLLTPVINSLAPSKELPLPIDAGAARTGGLLHNLGLLFVVHNFAELSEQAFQVRSTTDDQSLNDIFLDVLGIKPTDAGEILGKEMALPGVLTAAMAYYDDTHYEDSHWQVVATLALAIKLAGVVNQEVAFEAHESKFGHLITEPVLNGMVDSLNQAQRSIQVITKSIKW